MSASVSLTPRHVHDALRTVKDPETQRDIVGLGLVKDARVDARRIDLIIELPPEAASAQGRLRADIEASIAAKADEVGAPERPELRVQFTEAPRKANEQVRAAPSPLPGVTRIVAVGAGKGGVGKSTVAVALAVGLARLGARTGLLDGDIYGPSAPTMLGLGDEPRTVPGEAKLVPFEVHGIKAMSIGSLVDSEKPLIWRGPMAHRAFQQLAMQTDWGSLDYLIVDLPPGTGDVPLTLAQMLPLTGAVVVCTPQRVAQDDARRAVRMFQQLGVEVLGLIENMSGFVGDDGKEYELFGKGGAETMAGTMGVPFLGALPIHVELRANCDQGTPLRNWEGNPALAQRLDELCRNLANQVSLAQLGGRLGAPKLTVR